MNADDQEYGNMVQGLLQIIIKSPTAFRTQLNKVEIQNVKLLKIPRR